MRGIITQYNKRQVRNEVITCVSADGHSGRLSIKDRRVQSPHRVGRRPRPLVWLTPPRPSTASSPPALPEVLLRHQPVLHRQKRLPRLRRLQLQRCRADRGEPQGLLFHRHFGAHEDRQRQRVRHGQLFCQPVGHGQPGRLGHGDCRGG